MKYQMERMGTDKSAESTAMRCAHTPHCFGFCEKTGGRTVSKALTHPTTTEKPKTFAVKEPSLRDRVVSWIA